MSSDDEDLGSGADDRDGPPRSHRLIRQRPTKLQIAALGLITLLSLGPIVAVVAVVRSDTGPVETLIDGPDDPDAQANVVATLTGVSASAGELRVRITVAPNPDLLSGGRLREDLVLRINDTRGADTYDFQKGEPLRPIDGVLALNGGSVVRYPFDEYSAVLSVTLDSEGSGDPRPVPFSFDVLSNVDEFRVSASQIEGGEQPTLWAVVDVGIERGRTTTLYAVWMMVLMWGLAIAGVMIIWAVTIWQVEVPYWTFGYLVGVLFALPQLRELLPGRPPPGTLLDFVAFYWSIAIVGVTLVALLAIWVQRNRPSPAE